MNFGSFDKKTLSLITALLLFCVFLICTAFYLLITPDKPSPDELAVLSLTPNPATILIPEKSYTFTVRFNKPISPADLSVEITEMIPSNNNPPTQIPVTLSLDKTNKILSISSTDTFKAYATYTVSVGFKNDPKKLVLEKFDTQTETPSRVPKNNATLKQFLPYETATYSLTYWAEKNIYLFNLKFDTNSRKDTNMQYSEAKQQALSFIRSKGINPDTITIEWRLF